VGVSWDDAVLYAEWAGLRLPSESEWEYACRVGSKTRFYKGDSEEDLDRVGWYDKNSGERLFPVGEKGPNAFCLYDMHGNVWEWIEDDYHDNYQASPSDGKPWFDLPRSNSRVVRGGSYGVPSRVCRSASRSRNTKDHRYSVLGFRLARSI